ncbi:hypothetical protein C0J52_17107 [Blattella germanica]|nr:hypothetical protein C0J52_17107 [Blattella germanica]
MNELYVDFKKAYDSIKREKLYIGLIRMYLNGTKSRVRVGKQVSDIFEIHNGLKQGDAPVQLIGIHKLLLYADDIVLLGDSEEKLKDNMHILRSNTRKLGLEVNITLKRNIREYTVIRRNESCNANGQLMTNEGNYDELLSKNIKPKIYKTVILPVIFYGCETWRKRPVGRPRMKWENNINHDLREIDHTGDDWKTLAQDRDV